MKEERKETEAGDSKEGDKKKLEDKVAVTEDKVAVIVQCRVSSTRLPGKALKTLGGRSILEYALNAMKKVKAAYYYLVTDKASIRILTPIAVKAGFSVFEGSLNNVLDRFCRCIKKIGDASIIVRATADNPFIFYEAASYLLDSFIEYNKTHERPLDYMNLTGLPYGAGVEVFLSESLLFSQKNTQDKYDLEHVGPALYRHKDLFNCLSSPSPLKFYYPFYRLTVDTARDFHVASNIQYRLNQIRVQKKLGGKKEVDLLEPYSSQEVIDCLKDKSAFYPILFIPSIKKEQGTGHLIRMIKACIAANGYLYIDKRIKEEERIAGFNDILKLFTAKGGKNLSLNEKKILPYQIVKNAPQKEEYALIVLDTFTASKEEVEAYQRLSNVMLIDCGGDGARKAGYALNIIPSLIKNKGNKKFNSANPLFIEAPKKTRGGGSKSDKIKNILVSFGGEDKEGLSLPAATYFAKAGYNITVILQKDKIDSEEVLTASYKTLIKYKNITFIQSIENLKDKLYKFDAVVTHYGLTAYEALLAKVFVVLVSPTTLHERLGKKYGFYVLDRKRLEKKFIPSIFNPKNIARYTPDIKKLAGKGEEKTLSQFIKSIGMGASYSCPYCEDNKEVDDVIYRTSKKTYRICGETSLIYLSFSKEEKTEYDEKYFNSEYKEQYGKTYLEDFEHIKALGRRRLAVISKIKEKKGGRKEARGKEEEEKCLLDIGAAYGAFISAARESGYRVLAQDISAEGVRYIKEDLKLEALQGDFLTLPIKKIGEEGSFDVVTAWYTMEHFTKLTSALNKIYTLLKVGGVFALSVPVVSGILGLFNKEKFYTESPLDHYSVFNLKSVKRILKKAGFCIKVVRSTGVHPERLKIINAIIKRFRLKEGSGFIKAVSSIIRLLKLGDTAEIYAIKR